MKRRVVNHTEAWESRIPFRISNYVWDDYPAVVCEIEQDGVIGRGEALGVYYLDETEKTMLRQLEAIARAAPGRPVEVKWVRKGAVHVGSLDAS